MTGFSSSLKFGAAVKVAGIGTSETLYVLGTFIKTKLFKKSNY